MSGKAGLVPPRQINIGQAHIRDRGLSPAQHKIETNSTVATTPGVPALCRCRHGGLRIKGIPQPPGAGPREDPTRSDTGPGA